MDIIPSKIQTIAEYKPNTTHYRIRLDANESPFAADGVWEERMKSAIQTSLNRYPDPMATDLCEAFKKAYGVESASVAVGNGSDELISILCTSFVSKGDKVLVVAPDFSMYEFYLSLAEAQVVKYEKNDDFEIDFTVLAEMARDEEVAFCIFSNPCNPTGRTYSREQILSFVESVPMPVVVDEAYMDFAGGDFSVLGDAPFHDNLIVLKTLSKIGFAALRIGFAVGDEPLIGAIRRVKSPYNVNCLSQWTAKEVLDHFDEVKERTAYIQKNVKKLHASLTKLTEGKAIKVMPTEANFVTLRFDEAEEAARIFEELKEKDIIVRYTLGRCLRITCGLEEENKEFLTAFASLL